MKKLISTLSVILFMGVVAVSAQCCKAVGANISNNTKLTCSDNQKSSEIKVYYFHATRRCATCQAVEAVSKEAIKEYYADKVILESINREEEKASSLVENYKISRTALFIVKGDKKVDITNVAFMNARTNPDKLKAKIKTIIDSML